jgi:hypothetical protein
MFSDFKLRVDADEVIDAGADNGGCRDFWSHNTSMFSDKSRVCCCCYYYYYTIIFLIRFYKLNKQTGPKKAHKISK